MGTPLMNRHARPLSGLELMSSEGFFFSCSGSVMTETNGTCLEAIGDILYQVILDGDESGKDSQSELV